MLTSLITTLHHQEQQLLQMLYQTNTSLEELYKCDDNFIGQAAAKALGSANSNNTKLKILKLWDKYGGDVRISNRYRISHDNNKESMQQQYYY